MANLIIQRVGGDLATKLWPWEEADWLRENEVNMCSQGRMSGAPGVGAWETWVGFQAQTTHRGDGASPTLQTGSPRILVEFRERSGLAGEQKQS